MEIAVDKVYVDKLAAKYGSTYLTQTKYKYPVGFEDYTLAPDYNGFAAIKDLAEFDKTNQFVGKFRTSATELATQTKYVTDYDAAVKKYEGLFAAYLTSTTNYTDSYITMLTEVWDDFIGVPRVVGKEADRAALVGAPVSPKAPAAIDAKYKIPAAADFACLGSPCSAVLPLADDNTKNFGVFGLKKLMPDMTSMLNPSSTQLMLN